MKGGLKEKGLFNKVSTNNHPLISIISCVFNSERFIEKTIKSIINQTYENIEYIIIDGYSIDKTIDIIKKYEDKVAFWQSEPDSGLYDAMNKGIELSSGDYLLFINAGDEIHDNNTIQNTFQKTNNADIYYGETEYIDMNGNILGLRSKITSHKLPQNLSWENFNRGMVVCHQSFIVKKEIAPKYNLQYNFSSDIDWEIRCLKNSKKTINTNLILSRFLEGGMSKKYHLKSLLERYRVLQKHFGFLTNLWNHFRIVGRMLIIR